MFMWEGLRVCSTCRRVVFAAYATAAVWMYGGCLRECGGGGVGGLVHDSSGKQPTSSVGGILSEKRGVEGGIAGCCILGCCSVWGIHQAGGGITGCN